MTSPAVQSNPQQPRSAESRLSPALHRSRMTALLLLAATVVALIWCSLHLAATRIYQVDECMEVYVANVLSSGHDPAAAGHVTLFQALLSLVLPHAARSSDLFASARVVMLVLFWANWLLMATATGERVLSVRWFAALAAAATLAPLWDYGFEIRHDNLLLAGILVLWCVVRLQSAGLIAAFMAGVLAVSLQFVAFKAFVYTAPLSAAFLLLRRPAGQIPRWKLASLWLAGAAAAFTGIRLVFGAAGWWEPYLASFRFLSTASTGEPHVWPVIILNRLLTQTPLLLALLVSASVALFVEFRKRRSAALTWDGILPEGLLFLGAVAALLINPVPYPYNVLHLVPFAFLFAFRHAVALAREIRNYTQFIPAAAAVLVFAHLIPFEVATRRHLEWPNTRQEGLMRLAEDLTDPMNDPVYDAIGMVPTRGIVDNHAFLHSLNFRSFVQGPGPQVRDMLAARPAPVLIPSYRTDWLPAKDHEFIDEHYVSVADDFCVLGKVLPPGGGTFEIIHAGRYRICHYEASDLAGTYADGILGLMKPKNEPVLSGTVDGMALTGGPAQLSAGKHQLACDPDTRSVVLWVGPHLDRLPRIGRGDHHLLFVNWY